MYVAALWDPTCLWANWKHALRQKGCILIPLKNKKEKILKPIFIILQNEYYNNKTMEIFIRVKCMLKEHRAGTGLE